MSIQAILFQNDDSGFNQNSSVKFDSFSNSFIRLARISYLVLLLLFVLLFQNSQATFINMGLLVPVYIVLSISFFLNTVYLLLLDKLKNQNYIEAFLFSVDAILIAFMNHLASGNFTFFLILFLLNIVLCGLKFKANGALLLALWTSSLFSVLLILGEEVSSSTFYLSVLINNFSFFAVAYLAGFLSYQFENLNIEVESKTNDLLELQKVNELIVTNISSGLMYVDSNLKVNYSNLSTKEIIELDPTKKLLKEVFFHEFIKINNVLLKLKKGQSDRVEMRLATPSGLKDIEFHISAVKSEKSKSENSSLNNETGYVFLMNDLTQIKQFESKLRQQEKLAAVGQLAAGIAHEIRNPLASISGSVQLMQSSNEPISEENKKLMSITIKEIDRLNGLISEFLEYVKPEKPYETFVDVNSVLKEVMGAVLLDKTLNSNIKQDLSLNSKKDIVGDSNKLKQAFLNIVINAYQAMSNLDLGSIRVRTWDKENKVIVVIEDMGVGIPGNNLERIFEPFHTTKPKGSGLGLAITHKILESHGANIFVESEINKGTVFTIEFVCSNDPLGNELKMAKEA